MQNNYFYIKLGLSNSNFCFFKNMIKILLIFFHLFRFNLRLKVHEFADNTIFFFLGQIMNDIKDDNK